MRLLPVTLVVLALASAAQGAAPPAGGGEGPRLGLPVFVLSGGGYGHGVGMSQHGALGQARAGRTYRDILATYYPGTQLTTRAVGKVRVLLAERVVRAVVSSAAPLRVRDAVGATFELPAGEVRLTPKLTVEVEGVPTPLVPPLVFAPTPGATVAANGLAVRGELRVEVEGGRLRVINALPLEQYLLGVVPGEMPREWPAEALKAQAVAARTYAVAGLLVGRSYDLYADVRSQVYRGVAAEAATTTLAVKETAGEILTWAGKPITTFYSSSSGGRTASAADAFGLDLPYLPSQADPWDTASPYFRWPPRALGSGELRKAFGLSSPVVDVELEPTPSGRPSIVRLLTRAGGTFEVKPGEVRTRLALRSTFFRIGVLRLQAGRVVARPGERVLLAGLARDVDAPVLERRVGTSWKPAARLRPRSDGTFAVAVRPPTTTRYRLAADGVAGPSVLVVADAPPAEAT